MHGEKRKAKTKDNSLLTFLVQIGNQEKQPRINTTLSSLLKTY